MPFIAAELQAFASGFPLAILHLLLSLFIWAVSFALHTALAPGRPIDQVRHGNGAATVAVGGVMLSLALPLGAAMAVSASTAEAALWGAAISVIQLLLLRVADMALRGLPERIRDGDITAAVLISCARLAVAILLACAVLR